LTIGQKRMRAPGFVQKGRIFRKDAFKENSKGKEKMRKCSTLAAALATRENY